MEPKKFANLTNDQIDEIIKLEEKLLVTLLAYDVYPEEDAQNYNVDPDIINPS